MKETWRESKRKGKGEKGREKLEGERKGQKGERNGERKERKKKEMERNGSKETERESRGCMLAWEGGGVVEFGLECFPEHL